MAQTELGFAPKAGVMVVFRSKRGDRVKVLVWDSSGIVMIYKWLEQGGFAWPKVGDGVMRLSQVQFEALFAGLDWRRIHAPRRTIPTTTE
jgi:transposase